MYNINWSRKELTNQKLGAFCEYYAKMVFAPYGMDIYTSEVDDHGIDFVAETTKGFMKFQVKSLRNASYTFVKEDKFDITDDSLYLVLVILNEGKHPEIFLIPTSAWKNTKSKLFTYHSYEKPEYGVNLSNKNMSELEVYRLENMLDTIL